MLQQIHKTFIQKTEQLAHTKQNKQNNKKKDFV